MGCGKSTVGPLLASLLNYPFIDLDTWIAASEGKSVTKIFSDNGEPFFRQLESAMLQHLINEYSNAVIACGGGTPCHGDNLGLMEKHGITIYLRCDERVLSNRLIEDEHKRPLLSQPGFKLGRHLAERTPFYERAQLTVDAHLNPEAIAQQIAAKPLIRQS